MDDIMSSQRGASHMMPAQSAQQEAATTPSQPEMDKLIAKIDDYLLLMGEELIYES